MKVALLHASFFNHDFSAKRGAKAKDDSALRINEIVRERRGITADTALRLARFFNTSHQFWMNLQAAYDLQCAEDAAGRAIARIKPLAATELAAQG